MVSKIGETMNNTLYLIRHGETDYNKSGIFQGHLDILLNNTGVFQAKELRKIVNEIDFDIIFCSPIYRAIQTAKISLDFLSPELRFYNQLIIDNRISERNYGILQGVEKVKYWDKIKNTPQLDVTKSFTAIPKNGESYLELEKRIVSFLNEISKKYSNKKILIFTHNGPIRIILKFFKHYSLEDIISTNSPYCEIIKIYENP